MKPFDLSTAQVQVFDTETLRQTLDIGQKKRAATQETAHHFSELLDHLLYDINNIQPEEAVRLAPRWAVEGVILIVPPSGQGLLQILDTVDEFFEYRGHRATSLVIASPGCSALGAAAFARNVADATGETVAAVLPRYDAGDVASEALGGLMRVAAKTPLGGLIRAAFTGKRRAPKAQGLTDSHDTDIIQALLTDHRVSFDLIVGHHRGNAVLAHALTRLNGSVPRQTERVGARTSVVTFGTPAALPVAFDHVVRVIGEHDWRNAEMPVDVVVPGAGHHTNRALRGAVPVTATLKHVLGIA
ncbi:hypothetical protein GCM10011497_30990 [Elstera cyanobacteriorum]|uniref:Uncharacterized protein n=1 Tax=Elstera cyanobacteriorum TaxID=2022747 RepID=A0A255XXA4_9PROT|nr:hypothetical protein [Elstera cyanobacteriorum]OYQ21004.1 hypothetical protein CHR90_03480 [Elstera cyanobacteriorum]GFZ98087.1 hypothetical protein GCM10011497_30990 [Elstera cyanobacteriorum]